MNRAFPVDAFQRTCDVPETESNRFTFLWEITNFSERTEAYGEYLRSKKITINKGPGSKPTTWYVYLYPKGIDENSRGYVSVYLHNDSDCDLYITASPYYKLNQAFQFYHSYTFDMEKVLAKKGCKWSKLFNRDDVNIDEFVPNGTLTLMFYISVHSELEEPSKENEDLSKTFHQDQLSKDMGQLFSNKMFADVKITCGDKTFQCHKSILASRSPVFNAMFVSNMTENDTGCVRIENMLPEVLDQLLNYIYTGIATSLDTLVKEVLAAAHLYQVEKLKQLCEEKLSSNIDVENCIDLLVLSDLHQASILKDKSLKFLSRNIEDVNNWKETLKDYPALMVELIAMMMPKRKSSDGSSEGDKRVRTE